VPAVFLFQMPSHVNPHVYLYSGYFSAWGIYVIYLLFLMNKLGKLKKEEAELR
jgi:hypothetical protein